MKKKTLLPPFFWWGVAIVAVAFPVLPLFDHLGKPEIGHLVYFAIVPIAVVILVCRELRSRLWFWLTLISIAVLHVPLIMHIAKPLYRVPGREMYVLVVVDALAILAVIGLIEKLTGSKTNQQDVKSVDRFWMDSAPKS
jgi:hypothetical protein